MAKITNTGAPTTQARLDEITNKIYQTCIQVTDAMEDVTDTKAAADEASKGATSKRETIMGEIAKISLAGNWTERETELASKAAAKRYNNTKTKKAMETFMGEIKHAAHPNVRDHFSALVSIRDAAWQEETDMLALDKASPQPLRKCFKRSYHALMQAMAVAEKGVVWETVQDMVDYANANDPDTDAKYVFKQLEAMRAKLTSYAVEFPADDLRLALDALTQVTWAALASAQAARKAEETPVQVTTTVAPQVTTTTAPQANTQVNSTTVAVAKPTFPVATQKVVPMVVPVASNEVDLDGLLGDNLDIPELKRA